MGIYIKKQLYFLYLLVVAMMLGCAPALHSIKSDKAYNQKIQSIVVIEQQNNLTNKYYTLKDRTYSAANALALVFAKEGLKNQIFTANALELNLNEKISLHVSEINASHIITVQPISATVRVQVDYYQLEYKLTDIKTQKTVWRGVIHADWYSSATDIANKIIADLKKDELL